MRTKLLAMKSLFVLAGFLLMLNTLSATNWFVKPNVSGTGASWDDPANISVIGSSVADGDVVYVAAGDYTRSTSLTISKYIRVKGGFSSSLTGVDTTTCDYTSNKATFVPIASPTAGFDTRCLNISAVAPSVAGQKIVLDGLYFNGFAMSTGNSGCALNITTAQGDIILRNLSFTNNISLNGNGGAVYMGSFAYNIAISFDNCNFSGNQATFTAGTNSYGGAVYLNNGATAKTINLTNCVFKNNKAYNRAGAIYFTQSMTCSMTDCTFDSNQLTNPTDAVSSGGCFYIAGGGTAAVVISATRCVFLNSNSTQYGSVIYFNTTPKNTLNLTNCSLIGNYASRTTSARAAIDCSSYATILGGSITGTVMSNYNYSGGAKAANKSDLMYLTGASTDVNMTFANSILNGTYFSSSNASAAVSPSVLYTTTGYLADSTINLALSGDLKITDKIVFKKTFSSGSVGTYTHAQIFDVKAKLNIPMTLVATIPTGYKLTVDGTDYTAGVKTIVIAASASSPAISLSVDTSTGINTAQNNFANVSTSNGKVLINNIHAGNNIAVYNAAGQLLNIQSAKSNTMSIDAKGFVIVKINSGIQNQVTKLIVK